RSSGGPKQVVAPKQLTVSGIQPYTDTGILLKKGDEVAVTASGTVFPAIPDRRLFNGPDGLPNRPDLVSRSVVATSDHDSLIGKIGPSGTPFFVGAAGRFKADSAGPFFLGINDVGLENNDGSFQARVTVTRQ
ncbi:MAG: hypothetical protein JWP02_300, partial [Acidimicrobiales bacterium]|nr:hypothetical protein [Acidimicrobiales bacterium]